MLRRYYNMGVTLQRPRQVRGSIEAYDKAISIKPDYAEVYNNMANVFQEKDKLKEAVEA